GIDGEMTFLANGGTEVKRILISAKSGHVTPAMVRELRGTVEREEAAIGILVTLNPPTAEMEREAVRAGWYKSPMWEKRFRRLQIITAEQLTTGVRPDLPSGAKSGMPASAKVTPTVDIAQEALDLALVAPPVATRVA